MKKIESSFLKHFLQFFTIATVFLNLFLPLNQALAISNTNNQLAIDNQNTQQTTEEQDAAKTQEYYERKGIDPESTQQTEEEQNTQQTTEEQDAAKTQEYYERKGIDPESTQQTEEEQDAAKTQEYYDRKGACEPESGKLHWIICPSSESLSKAIDSIYNVIEKLLIIEPISSEETSIVHIVWGIVRDITNIVFIIFILIVVYSQITGLGITNYGIKRVLPRIIITALLVNLSFILCQIFVDISNISGFSLKDLLDSIQKQAATSIVDTEAIKRTGITWSSLIEALIGGGLIANLGISFVGSISGFFWLVLPILLGALFSIIIGVATVSMRQAVVSLLVMISPLAFVCYLLPNTEKWFKRWKDILISMLIFYPTFSFLFGASKLAGWSILASSTNEYGVIIGLAVQVYPLFAAIPLMKMSNSVLGVISARMTNMSRKPLTAFTAYSMGRHDYAKSKYLASQPKGLNQKMMQRIKDRQNRRFEDTIKYKEQIKLRGQSYASKLTNSRGRLTRRAVNLYEMQADGQIYQKSIAKAKNDFNAGLGTIEEAKLSGTIRGARIKKLDGKIVEASDNFKYELGRGIQIEAENEAGHYERTQRAINAHLDKTYAGTEGYIRHFSDQQQDKYIEGITKYNSMYNIVGKDTNKALFLAGNAASSMAISRDAITKRFNALNDLTPATQDIIYNLAELTAQKDSTKNIDAIISGMRVLNKRGDANLIVPLMDSILLDQNGKNKIELGTYASQSLANFLMFEISDKDPLLRRYGKYINMETARCYNNDVDPDKRRRNRGLSFDEYITGEYENYASFDPDENGEYQKIRGKSKFNAIQLMAGTAFSGMERTALDTINKAFAKAYTKNGQLDVEKWSQAMQNLDKNTFANLIGDHFAFKSGSEQIKATSKYVTGIKDGSTDFEGIFGKDIADQLSDEQKTQIEAFYSQRTKDFLQGQVPNQIARTKSDMFNPIMDKLTKEAMQENPNQTSEYYKKQAAAKFRDILDEKDLLYQVVLMRHKGYQGDTKANMAKTIELDSPELISWALKRKHNKEKGIPDTDDDDGDLPYQHLDNTSYSYNNDDDILQELNAACDDNSIDLRTYWEIVQNNILQSKLRENPDLLYGINIELYSSKRDLLRDIISQLNL